MMSLGWVHREPPRHLLGVFISYWSCLLYSEAKGGVKRTQLDAVINIVENDDYFHSFFN